MGQNVDWEIEFKKAKQTQFGAKLTLPSNKSFSLDTERRSQKTLFQERPGYSN